MSEHSRGRHEEFHFNNCVIRSDTRELLRDGVAQKIERRSFDLILYLLKLEGRVAGKDELLEHVWGNKYVTDSVIAQSIMKARKALGISGKEPGPIKTIHRVGYRFTGDIRQVRPMLRNGAHGQPAAGRVRILWLPTECDMTQPGLSWVRYGLISVATQLLQSHAIATVSVSESIQLYESSPTEHGAEALASLLRVQSAELGVVASRLVSNAGEYRLEWQMSHGGVQWANSVTGSSPAEMALMVAQEISLRARLQSLQPVPAVPDASFWKELEKLISLAESLHLTEQLAPLLGQCVPFDQCPVRAVAECLWIHAQRADPQVLALAEKLIERVHQTAEAEYAGWAELCLALFHLHTLEAEEARQCVQAALPIVRRHAIGRFRPRALLLASHVLAALHHTDEAHALLNEVEKFVTHSPRGHLSCAAQLQRCDLAYLNMQIAAPGQPFSVALAHARHMGFQAPAAWLEVYCGLQHLAMGDFDQCHQHLDAALIASERSDASLAHVYTLLQMGTFFARLGDQPGLEQCLVRLAQAALRDTPLGAAAWRWLRARHLLLAGRAPEALPLAEHAMHELADLGIWWSEDNWIFVAQVALLSGKRSKVQQLLLRLQARLPQGKPLAHRRAVALAVQGMLACFDGEPTPALQLFEQAHGLARHAALAQVLLFGLVWLALVDGQQPMQDPLAASGHWCERTREGRLVRATVEQGACRRDQSYRYQHTLALGTGTDHRTSLVSDAIAAEAAHLYTACLPMPV